MSLFLSSVNVCGAHSVQEAGSVSALHHVLAFHPTETYPSYWCHVSGSKMHPRSVIPGKMLKTLVVVEVTKSCRFFFLRVSSTLSTLYGISLLPADWRAWIMLHCSSQLTFLWKNARATNSSPRHVFLKAAVATFLFTVFEKLQISWRCRCQKYKL